MNNINPLYILFFLISLVIFSWVIFIKDEHNLNVKIIKENAFISNIDKYKDYKENWNNKNKVNFIINKLQANKMFRNERIIKTVSNNKINLTLKSNKQAVLNKFLNLVLNEKLILNKISLDKNQIYFEIGI